MDSLMTAAARALAQGDPLGALNRVALRDDPPALALRGIAMAQLGDLVRAKDLLRRAARAFGAKEAGSRARCIVAEAEVALAARDLGWSAEALDAARVALEARRSGERRARAISRDPAASPHRPARRSRATARRARPCDAAADAAGGPRAGDGRNRDAPPARERGARGAGAGGERRARGRHSGARGGGCRRLSPDGLARGAPDRQGRDAAASA